MGTLLDSVGDEMDSEPSRINSRSKRRDQESRSSGSTSVVVIETFVLQSKKENRKRSFIGLSNLISNSI
jgi:hypothetical protein